VKNIKLKENGKTKNDVALIFYFNLEAGFNVKKEF